MLGHMQSHSIGGPGGDESSAERMLAFARRMNPPENEIPVAVPISTLLARTDDIAIALIDVQAHTVGLRFDLAVRLRHEPRGSMRHKSYAMLNHYAGGEDADQQFLLGVEFADGRTVTNFGHPGFGATPPDEDPEKPSLSPMGGGGGGRSYDQSYWLTPLPPAGPLVVVCAWSAFDLPESRTVVDGAAIAEAGSRAVVLWPWSPPEEEPFEPPTPRVPEGGWFDRVSRVGQVTDGPLD
jgi:hypothetical protein